MEITTEQKVANLKVDLYKDILSVISSVTYDLNSRATEVFKTLTENVKNGSNEPIYPRRIELSQEQWAEITDFLYTCKEKDLVHHSTKDYIRELNAAGKIKKEILNKL